MALAILFGAIIGFERQWRHKNAGIKTNTLVAMGAAGFAMLSNTFGIANHNPGQIAAAVVTGIGFIGAGVIIHRGATVQGVTTAATLWVNASMGMAVGLGQIYVSTTIFAGVVIVQLTMRRLEDWIEDIRRGKAASSVELVVHCEPSSIPQINDTWTRYAESAALVPMRRSIARGTDHWSWRMTIITREKHPLDLAKLEEMLVAINGVKRVDARFLGYEDEPSPGM
jgi:putative Mg2+ transporter-C (MgtC) family protein